MKELARTTLQQPNERQQSVVFGDAVQQKIKGMGWEKGTPLAVYQHGAGLYICKPIQVEVPLPQKLEAPADKKKKKEG